jgi:hypothetical protein
VLVIVLVIVLVLVLVLVLVPRSTVGMRSRASGAAWPTEAANVGKVEAKRNLPALTLTLTLASTSHFPSNALIRSGIEKVDRVAGDGERQDRSRLRFHLFVDQCNQTNICADA